MARRTGPSPAVVARWEERVAGQRASGLSVAEFCRRERIHPVTFYGWRRRLADGSKRGGRAPTSRAFLPIELVTEGAALAGLFQIWREQQEGAALSGGLEHDARRLAVTAPDREAVLLSQPGVAAQRRTPGETPTPIQNLNEVFQGPTRASCGGTSRSPGPSILGSRVTRVL